MAWEEVMELIEKIVDSEEWEKVLDRWQEIRGKGYEYFVKEGIVKEEEVPEVVRELLKQAPKDSENPLDELAKRDPFLVLKALAEDVGVDISGDLEKIKELAGKEITPPPEEITHDPLAPLAQALLNLTSSPQDPILDLASKRREYLKAVREAAKLAFP